MKDPIKVTFLFDSDEHFHHFLEANKIDVYTYNWKKREYLVDLTKDVKESMSGTEVSQASKAQESTPVADFI